jgi:hypothetical protein
MATLSCARHFRDVEEDFLYRSETGFGRRINLKISLRDGQLFQIEKCKPIKYNSIQATTVLAICYIFPLLGIYCIKKNLATLFSTLPSRPKKTTPCVPATRTVRDDDPCLDSIATESILPLIPDRASNPAAASGPGSGTAGAGFRGSQGTQVRHSFSRLYIM